MGDCHYLDGNLKAEKMFNMTLELVNILGIEPERMRLHKLPGNLATGSKLIRGAFRVQ
jgi:coenzyme F420-reducing hydrogenase delta subunit